MADRSMKFTLDFLAKTAGLKDAADLADKLGEELDESADQGTALAKALELVAGKAEAELAETKRIADSLRAALGADFTGEIDELAVHLRQAGMSADQVDANIDSLTASVRRLDSVASSTDGVAVAMRRVGTETDNTRSVVANFAGNAVQELPGVAGAMGPLNMAMGQFAEYAAEGNIGMKNFVKAGAGLAGAAVAMWAISKGAKQAAERTAEITKAIEELNEVSDEQALRSLTDMLTNALLNGETATEVFRELADTNLIGARRLLDLGAAAGMNADMMAALSKAIDEQVTREDRAADVERRYGDQLDDTAGSVRELSGEYRTLREVVDSYYASQRQLIGGTLELEEQTDRVEDALASYNEMLTSGTASLEEIDDAGRDAQRMMIDLAAATVTANGANLDSRDGVQQLIAQLQSMADALAPTSPLRARLQAYINQLLSIPSQVNTLVSINGAGASAGASAVGKNDGTMKSPDLKESLSAGRSAPSVNVTINATTLDPSMTVDAIERAVNDGVRRAWMAVS